jgi:hypothetical protein
MKTKLTLLTFSASLLFFLSSCGQTTNNKQVQKSTTGPHTIDTSKYAILKFDTTDTWLFENAKPSSLTHTEIEEIESILKQYIDAYNPDQQLQFDTISKAHTEYNLKVDNFVINLSRYKKQYFPVINSAGQKEVWVNCFCNDFDKNWRRDMVIVQDGGNCYFSLIINLVTKKISRFIVNGDA